MKSVRVEFEGLPPFKANPGPNAAGAKKRQADFRVVAQQAFEAWRLTQATPGVVGYPWDPMLAPISLSLTYYRGKGSNDAANIIGGVCDALQGIAYANDKQVRQILYSEPKTGEPGDLLVVEISTVDDGVSLADAAAPTQETSGAWDRRVDAAWSARAKSAGSTIPGPQAANSAAKELGAEKLSVTDYKTLQRLIDSSPWLSSRWDRQVNTIVRRGS